MKKEKQKEFYLAICTLAAFLLWTAAIQCIDVQPIGPRESSVGFATINQQVHNLTGVHMNLFIITDWMGLVPLGIAIGFALLGLTQWIKRKQLLKVDYNILVLGVFYIVVMLAYAFFEMFVVNYRPVLINGYLEASYPSSTTIMQFNSRINNHTSKRCVSSVITAFIVFMVIGRFVSGVHWLTDIIGGALLSAGLVMLYRAVISLEVG